MTNEQIVKIMENLREKHDPDITALKAKFGEKMHTHLEFKEPELEYFSVMALMEIARRLPEPGKEDA
jgi:hypothetical protein